MPAQKYTQIYLDLKEKIEDGTYPEQGYLPSEYTLIEQYGCSRNTVRRAISQLADEAYVQSIHGKGVIVIYHQTPKNEFSLGGIESLKEAARRNNRSYKTKVIQFTEFVVDEYLHRKTGFAIGEEVIYVQRVRYFDDIAEILDNNWLLKRIVRGLTPEICEDSVYEYMEQQLGEAIVTTKRRMSVEHATEIDEKYLDLGEYNCLAVITSQTYNGDGVMFEYTQSRHRPDKFVFYTQAQRTVR
ncbi:MAG: trehalose operon repressor [Lachnospiraceae bacterium]|nr:trehalose operon repressor [Lachnospiraceae bacterium]